MQDSFYDSNQYNRAYIDYRNLLEQFTDVRNYRLVPILNSNPTRHYHEWIGEDLYILAKDKQRNM